MIRHVFQILCTMAMLMAGTSTSIAQETNDVVENLSEAIVTSRRSPKSIVTHAAKKFSHNYIHDYVAPLLTVRTVSSDGKIRSIQAGRGIFFSMGFTQKAPRYYWDDPNSAKIGWTDTFVTETLYPDRNEVNNIHRVHNSDYSGIETLSLT